MWDLIVLPSSQTTITCKRFTIQNRGWGADAQRWTPSHSSQDSCLLLLWYTPLSCVNRAARCLPCLPLEPSSLPFLFLLIPISLLIVILCYLLLAVYYFKIHYCNFTTFFRIFLCIHGIFKNESLFLVDLLLQPKQYNTTPYTVFLFNFVVRLMTQLTTI